MKLATCVHQFFDAYLPHIKGVSTHTIKAYRDAVVLFLPFASHYHRLKIDSLRLEHLSSEAVLAFLDNLELERKNLAKTRNHRLAALKSLCTFKRDRHMGHSSSVWFAFRTGSNYI